MIIKAYYHGGPQYIGPEMRRKESSQCISEECECSIDGKPIINRVFETGNIFDSRSGS